MTNSYNSNTNITTIFRVNAGNATILDFIGAKDGGGCGDNWSYKTCKAPVKSSSSTNQRPAVYRPDALPVANQQCPSTEGSRESVTFHGFAHPKLTWGLLSLS